MYAFVNLTVTVEYGVFNKSTINYMYNKMNDQLYYMYELFKCYIPDLCLANKRAKISEHSKLKISACQSCFDEIFLL